MTNDEAALAAAKQSLSTARASLQAKETAVAALRQQHARLSAEVRTLHARRDTIDAKLATLQLNALVASGIVAESERAAFAELAKTDRALFDRMIAQRTPFRKEYNFDEDN